MKKKCKYENCRMEAERGSDYCKFHVRMVESYEKMSPELKEVYDRIKKRKIQLALEHLALGFFLCL